MTHLSWMLIVLSPCVRVLQAFPERHTLENIRQPAPLPAAVTFLSFCFASFEEKVRENGRAGQMHHLSALFSTQKISLSLLEVATEEGSVSSEADTFCTFMQCFSFYFINFCHNFYPPKLIL